jgi:hypothetical protein
MNLITKYTKTLVFFYFFSIDHSFETWSGGLIRDPVDPGLD